MYPSRIIAVLLIGCVAVLASRQVQAASSTADTLLEEFEVESSVVLDASALSDAFRHWQAGEYEQMLAQVTPLAEEGDPLAQFVMGSIYARGVGVLQDDEVALQWWRKAAEQGMARAQNELGVALTDGRGTEQDPAEALEWYRKAAEQGLAVAQANIGLLYLNGVGVPANEAQAVAWFRKAAEQELGWAQFYLGEAYSTGRGVRRNRDRAIEWYRRAAEQDYVEAQNGLARAYFIGEGIGTRGRDYPRAAYWFARAAAHGHQQSANALKLALDQLPRRSLRAAIEVRPEPDPASAVTRLGAPGEVAYILGRHEDWTEVYFQDKHTLGYVRTSELRR